MRTRKKIADSFTPEVREHLILLDFLGRLSPEEAKMAKKYGILKWNSWVRERNSGLAKVRK